MNNNKKIINIGLDVGLTTLGWVITDENLSIIERGVRTFDSVEDPKSFKLANVNRREKRSSRRMKERRITRKRDFVKYLLDSNLIDVEYSDKKVAFINNFFNKYIDTGFDLLKLRNEAVSGKQLSFNELLNVLYWYLSNRGFMYSLTNSDEDQKKAFDKLKKMGLLDSDKFPCRIQGEIKNLTGYYKGIENRAFSNEKYVQELKEIFKYQNQPEFSDSNFKKEFENKFLSLFTRQRPYEIGPGKTFTPNDPAKANVTKYGVFHYDEKLQKVVSGWSSIWEKPGITGEDYRGEPRAPKNSHEAEMFNVIQDLNNLKVYIEGKAEKLDNELKHLIIEKALSYELKNETSYKKGLTLTPHNIVSEIFDYYNLDTYIEEMKSNKLNASKFVNKNNEKEVNKFLARKIEGFRITDNKVPLFSDLNLFHDINKLLIQSNDISNLLTTADYFPWNIISENGEFKYKNETLRNISDVLFKAKSLENRQILLSQKLTNFSKSSIEAISKYGGQFSNTHSLGYNSLNEEAKILVDSPFNHMQWISAHENYRENNFDFETNGRRISTRWIKTLAASPTVKRSLYQTIGLLSAILKKYKYEDYLIDNIVVEMPRDKNSKLASEKLKDIQKNNKAQSDKVIEILRDHDISEAYLKNISATQLLKARLWVEQNYKDFYTGKDILAQDLFEEGKLDIDHALPISKSFTDSFKNKVLTTFEQNAAKSNKTPYQYLSEKGTYHEMLKMWKVWYEKNTDKLTFITINDNLDEESLGFIDRNLVDTRYIARVTLNALQYYFEKRKEIHGYRAKLKTTTGGMTSFLRKRIYEFSNPRNGGEVEKLKWPLDIPEFVEDSKTKRKVKNRVWYGNHSEDAYFSLYNALVDRRISTKIAEILSDAKHDNKMAKYQDERLTELISFNENIKDKSPYSVERMNYIVSELNKTFDNIKFSRMQYMPKNGEFANETLYQGRKTSDRTIDQIKYYPLNSEHDMFNKNKKDKNIFLNEESSQKVLMKIYDPKGFEQLKQIYINNLDKHDKNNPFMSPDLINQEQGKVISINTKYDENGITVKNQVVNGLNVIDQENKENFWVLRATENSKRLSYFDTLYWLGIMLFKNKKGLYRIIPMTALNTKFGKNITIENYEEFVKSEILDMQKQYFDIPHDSKPLFIFKRGQIVKLENDQNLYRISGHSFSQYKLELKPLHISSSPQKYFTINTSMLNARIYNIGFLGTIDFENPEFIIK
ncbi:CRISPR-associated Csn1 family endonuclease [Mycoplasma testudineum]|uniref:CRISPR-associated endonuclease Cas9 n=1 Tax=Mycoplasma testudineum TaxID=244584 RepID=A0A4V6PSB8_9MOLU|nr:type II CRISPR RNA-guided endonuclease Cas9 [Mycoplasma testudineum]OYD26793.1 type II CRISPR RNA-guided endonuclease Cas9 [Mycoplasma testudineum]TDO19929.1 CRISPR-associated Csn1 family endonuclease [Mycoplasma testudineum]